MRRLSILGCALVAAACAPVQQKPAPPTQATVETRPHAKPRFDSLAMLAQPATPERERIRPPFRYDRAIGVTGIDGVRYFFYEPDREREVCGFSLQNTGSPKVNPVGLKRKGAHREYAFLFPDRARENIHLTINDDVKLSGRFSHDNMFREMHFFPRRQLPTLEVDRQEGLVTVTLPTGEPVIIDRDSMELVGGALSEGPIDFTRSRHQRRNPDVRYRGDYLAITVAQRGEAPRRARVWGRVKYAEAHYPAKYPRACRLSPRYIWDQRPKPGDTDPKLTMLHASDEALFSMVERRCGWDLSALRESPPNLVRVQR